MGTGAPGLSVIVAGILLTIPFSLIAQAAMFSLVSAAASRAAASPRYISKRGVVSIAYLVIGSPITRYGTERACKLSGLLCARLLLVFNFTEGVTYDLLSALL